MHTLSLPVPRTARRVAAAIAVAVVVTLAIIVSLLRFAGATGTRAPSVSRLVTSPDVQFCMPHRPC
jgi:hypothetical protein